VGALGLNAWLVVYLIPALHVGVGSLGMLLLAALPLGLLVAGLASLGPRGALARWILLAGYPPSLAAVVAARPELATREAYDETAMLLAATSLLAYVASAAHGTSKTPAVKPVTTHPLEGKEPVVEPLPRRWLRRGLLTAAALGGLAVAVLAPALASRRARIDAWGEAADDGAVLTAVVASIVAAVAIGSIVGPGLRAERHRRSTSARSRRRLAAASLVAVASALAWLLLRHFDQALG
jgi:hypothetical protein